MKQDMGVDFSKNLYQPEQCESTGEFIHEREDHNHVLKRITECLRSREIPGVDVRHFVEALHIAESGELITIQFCIFHDCQYITCICLIKKILNISSSWECFVLWRTIIFNL